MNKPARLNVVKIHLLQDVIGRYRSVLTPGTNFGEDKRGNPVTRRDWTVRVDGATRLIPENDCRAIIKEVEAAMMPTSEDTAKAQGRVLVGSYPARAVNDYDVYIRAITSILMEYPADIGRSAIDELTRRLKWLPTRADVYEECEKHMRERKYIRDVAIAHLEGHEKRRKAAEEDERLKREHKAFRQKWGDAWDAWLKIPLHQRPPFDQWKEKMTQAKSARSQSQNRTLSATIRPCWPKWPRTRISLNALIATMKSPIRHRGRNRIRRLPHEANSKFPNIARPVL
ncbi:MAG: hypothetical protein V6Z86_09390 [Hyphomicrobiales bacterium]